MSRLILVALYAGGALHVAFAAFHLLFWKIFRWREELAKLVPLNRQVVQVLNLALTVAFAGAAYVSIRFAPDLATMPLGRGVCFAVAVFWLARLAMQFMFFDMRKPASWALSLACVVLVVIYGVPVFV